MRKHHGTHEKEVYSKANWRRLRLGIAAREPECLSVHRYLLENVRNGRFNGLGKTDMLHPPY